MCFPLAIILEGFFVAIKDGRITVSSLPYLPGPPDKKKGLSLETWTEVGRLRRSLPVEEAASGMSH